MRDYVKIPGSEKLWPVCTTDEDCVALGYDGCYAESFYRQNGELVNVKICKSHRADDRCISQKDCHLNMYCSPSYMSYDPEYHMELPPTRLKKCVPIKQEGDPCSPSLNSCPPGMFCDPAEFRCRYKGKRAKASKKDQRPCLTERDCPLDSYCDVNMGFCRLRKLPEEACTCDEECPDGYGCCPDVSIPDKFVCRRFCFTNLDCAPYGHCVTCSSIHGRNVTVATDFEMGFCFGSKEVLYREEYYQMVAVPVWLWPLLMGLAVMALIAVNVFVIWKWKRAKRSNPRPFGYRS